MNARRLTRIAVMAALTFIGGLIRIPVGPVPITLQTLVVTLSALLLSPMDALLSQALHLVLRFFTDGAGVVLTPSFGFLLGYLLAAFVGSYVLRGHLGGHELPLVRDAAGKLSSPRMIPAVIAAALCPYVLGLPYMAYILNSVNGAGLDLTGILKAGILPFIPGDTIKAVLAYGIAKLALPRIEPVDDVMKK
ncbi:MAG: biotin transporter BioY [Peptoniphilaceae bacterium]|nr:biotin transporter BioY [Peptoniphilaceae bacterium]